MRSRNVRGSRFRPSAGAAAPLSSRTIVPGATREVLVECVPTAPRVEEVPADSTVRAERFPREDRIRLVFPRRRDSAPRHPRSPRGPPPPPFPPAADVIARRGCDGHDRMALRGRGEAHSRGASSPIARIFKKQDASRAIPRTVRRGAASILRRDDRDVVFVVDASDAMGPEAFRGKTMDALQSLYCASHEGSQSRAAVVLWAPQRARARDPQPLGRCATSAKARGTRLWNGAISSRISVAIRRRVAARVTASDGERTRLTAAAPLAEALDGAGLELAERGAHDPSKRLVVVVSAGLPSPMVRDESCAEDADPTFASMTRDVPFSRAASDGGLRRRARTCGEYVPAAANRLKAERAIAAVNVAGALRARGSPPRGPPPRRTSRANRGSARATRTGSLPSRRRTEENEEGGSTEGHVRPRRRRRRRGLTRNTRFPGWTASGSEDSDSRRSRPSLASDRRTRPIVSRTTRASRRRASRIYPRATRHAR